MNFQQLRIVREAVQRNFNLTEVAAALYTSQSGVSKHIRDLEDELGVELFVRRGKRLLGLTEPGRELLGTVERILLDAKNLKRLAGQFSDRDAGQPVDRHHAHPGALCAAAGGAALQGGVSARAPAAAPGEPGARSSPCCRPARPTSASPPSRSTTSRASPPSTFTRWEHAVVVPAGHALAEAADAGRALTIEALAEQPVITYHEGYTGRGQIDAAFAAAGLLPDIVMSALDADVIKTYVEVGLGVGIVAAMAFDEARDAGLRRLDAGHLFGVNTTRIAVRRGHYLRGYAYRFLQECSPTLTAAALQAALDGGRPV